MKKIKRFLNTFLISALLCMSVATNVFAAENNGSVPTVEVTGGQEAVMKEIGLQQIISENSVEPSTQEIKKLDNMSDGMEVEVSPNALNRRGAWAIGDPVFVGNGTLDEAYDIYVVTLDANQTAFLKMESENNNLMAILYYVNNGALGSSTGWGVYSNGGASVAEIPAGQYAIVIGSSTGTETGDYKLMWNCSNPSGVVNIVSITSDLSRVVVSYDANTICSNGENILDGLRWEESVTWSMPLGYSARDMSIQLLDAKAIYQASFTSTAPYSAPNALLVEVNRGTWVYFNSYYTNDTGAVTHIMDWYDPSGLKTPRTFGEGEFDFAYGPSYIVIDLDTFQVCDFLSPFNYNYQYGGRQYTLTNVEQLH